MYVQCNTEARCVTIDTGKKSISIIYSWCVFVAVGTQHAMSMDHIFFRGLFGYTKVFHISHKRHNTQQKTEHKLCVLIFCTNFS
jgi:hypothetical protein